MIHYFGLFIIATVFSFSILEAIENAEDKSILLNSYQNYS